MMKMINLSESAINELSALPETGMGFQFVDATFWGDRKRFLVFNSEHAVDITELNLSTTDEVFELMQNERKIVSYLDFEREVVFAAPDPHSFQLISTRIASPSGTTGAPIAATPSTLVKHVHLPNNRKFYRFSAFNPDRRVDPVTGDFSPGTYATVESELPFVPTGFVAVGRFALPNNIPASYRYTIEAPKNTPVSFGTVAPAFSQSGGGVEAFFAKKVINQQKPMKAITTIPDE